MSWADPGSRYKKKLYRGWGATVGVAIQRSQGLRYGAAVRHDTALGVATRATAPATRHAVRTRHGWGGWPGHNACAIGAQAGFRVCTWYTQPSFDSMHYSESLFGTLFMNTVHEVFKKNKK